MRKIVIAVLIAGLAFTGAAATQLLPISAASAVRVTDDAGISGPVVIELFTSQGCSSCPPADVLARRLAKDGSLLVITRPVTYWDRLGWKDTLAREDNTRLQRTYAAKGNDGSGVYTPQIVVNGGGAAVGSRENDIRSLVRRADRNGPRISTATDSEGWMTVTISGKPDYMAGVRTLHYVNVVKAERNLGSWRGKRARFALSRADLAVRGADKYVIVVQRPGAGPIVAAKLLDI